ncbi:MAG: DNA polymerase III subunit beta [Chlamydiia bacterium]|nr:DNA polymerase III subunit beta [Chlamydiia bacterium]
MKFVMSRAELVKLMGRIQSVVSSKPAIPILSNILIEAYADQIILSATDLTVSMRTYTDAKVLQEGAITLPAKHFFSLIRELTAPQVEISADADEIVRVVAGNSNFKINGMGKAEFPTLPDFMGAPSFEINGEKFKTLLSKTAFAAAKDDSRQMLNGILMQLQGNNLGFVATDGKRLAKVRAQIEMQAPLEGQHIIPLKAVEEVIKTLDGEQTAKVLIGEDKIAIESGSTCFMTKLLSGDYPDIERVIPTNCSSNLHLHRDELISILRQVSLFTTDRSQSVRFCFSQGELKLLAASSELGEGAVSMPVDYSGEYMEIAFNPNFFLDILRHTKDETVAFGMSDPYNPGLITDKSAAQFVIMPMRIEQPAHVA